METHLPSISEKLIQTRAASKRISRFLEEFYLMLEKGTYSEFIDWNTEGTSIYIKDPNQFAEKVLPIYFKHSNLASFIRQLNMYDFKKQKHPQYNYVFSHEFFRRSQRNLLKNILRKSSSEYLRYQEKKRRREETAREIAQSRLPPQNSNSVYMENEILKKTQRQMAVDINAMRQQINYLQTNNYQLKDKFDNLKHEGGYLVRMMVALIEKLGEKTIFEIVQEKLHGPNSGSEPENSQPASSSIYSHEERSHENMCMTAETSESNLEQLLSCENHKQSYYHIPDLWPLDLPSKKKFMGDPFSNSLMNDEQIEFQEKDLILKELETDF